MKRILLILILMLSGMLQLFATHNRAGEIIYRHLGGLEYEVTVIMYSDPNSPAFARREIEIQWGDNTGTDSLTQTTVTNLTPTVSRRTWVKTHRYPGAGTYTIRMSDPNRNGGVDNIESSSGVPFYVETVLRISPFSGNENNSVILQNAPIDDACVGALFVHNPGATDIDGDSLAYEIAESRGANGQIAPGFTFPPASNSLTVDPISGDLIWDLPNQVGLYNVAILIKEYRDGVLMGTVLRDLQINVVAGCNNQPPVITAQDLICVEAGNTVNFQVSATDPDLGDLVRLTATGGVFDFSVNPASFSSAISYANPNTADFIWNTTCDHVRKEPYRISIKAEDDADTRGTTKLSAFKNVAIRVIAPGPQNAMAEAAGNAINLSWDRSICNDALGYRIYRRVDSSGYQPADCEIGVPDNIGYVQIADLDDINQITYTDNDAGNGLVPGLRYCYFIIAYFDDEDESYVSDEVCATLDKAVPIITKVSVNTTNLTAGKIDLHWSPPDTIDAQQFPPPYRYDIFRNAPEGFVLIGSTPSINDTTYVDSSLNTQEQAYTYRIALVSVGNGNIVSGNSPTARSIFLSINPFDNRLQLSWEVAVPWVNRDYNIYRQLPGASTFDMIATVSGTTYTDFGLNNGENYCYYIESVGDYSISSVVSPITNLSQIACEVPEDNIPPCAPVLDLTADCIPGEVSLSWTNVGDTCRLDVVSYRVYRAATPESDYELIETINLSTDTSRTLSLNSIAGCYAVTALDSSMNESLLSDTICVDNCPEYRLPNIFTPNNDNVNDLFIPFPYRYVESIDLTILNRWGQEVFVTQDPDINWDGIHLESGEVVSDGIYFYVCIVNEIRLEGIVPRVIRGTITIVDSQAPIID